MAIIFKSFRDGAVGFIDWLDATTGGVAALGEIAV